VTHAQELPRLIARHPPGARVSLKVIGKNGVARTVNVTLDELRDREKGKQEESSAKQKPAGRGDFGFDVGDDGRGSVVVRRVDRGSNAAEDIEPGDMILEVNGVPVKSANDALTRIRQTRSDRPLLLRIRRDGREGFIAIERG
jgi:serine protease Do